MALGSRTLNLDLSKYKPGLIFDADGITLLGKYTDELAAHRAKKRWVAVLNSYFLLDRERDYEMWVNGSLEDHCFVLSCSFVSACGRYAFWRLVNRQAPEAEERLKGREEQSTGNSLWNDAALDEEGSSDSWIVSALSQQISENEETANLFKRIIKLFS
jgi:hypothetical protein